MAPGDGQRRVSLLRRVRRPRVLPGAPGTPEGAPPTSIDTGVLEPVDADIPLDDPCLAYFQGASGPVEMDSLRLDTPGVRILREAGVRLVVPLVTQGELIGLLNLGPRKSDQDYSPDDRRLLESLARQAAPALRVAQLVREQAAEIRRRERYEQELQVAQVIQQNLLPSEVPVRAGWHLDAFYRPAREVGGDLYDFVDLPDGRLGVIVGDVTDKGIPAAMVMASTRSVLRASAQRLEDPGAVLARVNEQLVPDIPPKMFVTCLYGIMDFAAGTFRFANAGHNLPCLQTTAGAVEPRAVGMPLGLLPGADYEETEIAIGPGEELVLYSDAIPEAHDPDGSMFGFPQVAEVVGGGTGRMIGRLLDALERFTGPNWEQEDDITIVTIRRAGSEAGTPAAPALDELAVVDSFEVASEPGNERQAMDRVMEQVAHHGLSADRLEQLGTAVAEAVMNAIEHGNQGRPELPVAVTLLASDQAVVVRIVDQGGSEPIPDVTAPDIDRKLRGEESPRGWGLFLIRSMVDDLTTVTDEEHTTVELLIRREEGADG